MKKTFFAIIALTLLLAVCFVAPMPATAAHDDFDITYTVEPNPVGYKGADVNIGIRVENKGTTNITGFEVSVTTMAGYSQRWTGTITPGTTYSTVVFSVPFAEADLNADKLLYVKIENDGDGDYNDGTQVRTFQVEGTRAIFDIDWGITPDLSFFLVGDTVTITHTFTNTFASHAATDVESSVWLVIDDDFGHHAVDSHGMVMPGRTATSSFSYTFGAGDVGNVEILYELRYIMMGYMYGESNWSFQFDVYEPTSPIEVWGPL